MRHSALAFVVVAITAVSVAAQQSDARLDSAMDRIQRNDASGLRRLLQEDPSLVRRTDAGLLPHWNWTLLHSAMSDSASLAVIGVLLDGGAQVNVRDNEGNTPLHFATKRIGREKLPAPDYEGIIRLLLDRKADFNATNIAGATPLHTASASRADPSAIELLVQAGAAVNRKASQDSGGWTPLHGAAARGSADIVRVLLQHGADVSATDARGLTPLQVAQQGGFADAAAVLRVAVPKPATTAATPTVIPRSANAVAPASPATGPGVVQGRVLWNGQPVTGATVTVYDNPPGSVRYGTVNTDEQGRFLISGLPEGSRFVSVNGSPEIFALGNGGTVTVAATPVTSDFYLCKGFNTIAPPHNGSVANRPVLRWEPFPGAAYYVVVLQGKMAFNRGAPTGGLTETSLPLDVDLPPGRYEWRVYAYSAAGQSIGCTFGPRGFTVGP